MAMSESEALFKIMKAVSIPGEESTDGECIDIIIWILEELGMPVKEEIDKARLKYNNKTYIYENHMEYDGGR